MTRAASVFLLVPALVPALLLQSCGSESRAPSMAPRQEEQKNEDGYYRGQGEGAKAAPMGGMAPAAPPPSLATSAPKEEMSKGRDEAPTTTGEASVEKPADAPAPATRAWFPESFLWMPFVETDATGSASVTVPVPDTLTTWRLLALAQSAHGGQGGATTSFRSTLPAYVDVVTPRFLYAGDRLTLPVQVVNQQDSELRAALDVQVDGGTGEAGGTIAVAAYGSTVRAVAVGAPTPGPLTVYARLGSIDAVSRVVDVRPSGRPVETVYGGTLAGPRTLTFDGLPGTTSGTLDLVVFPGALGVIRRELALAGDRGESIHDGSYLYLLAHEARPLVGEGDVNDDLLRALSLRAVQRITRAARTPTPLTAAAALAGLRGADPETLEGRLADRLATTVTNSQQPDGLWGVGAGESLDVALLMTARCAWSLGSDEIPAHLRASGAVERFRERLKEPTVAAWALAAGLVDPSMRPAVQKTLADAIVTAPDGAKSLRGTSRVSAAEATAVAILATPGDTDEARALRADLATSLLSRWTPAAGFGRGWTNVVALRALQVAMGGEIPPTVRVKLERDGVVVGEGALDPAQPHAPIVLHGTGAVTPGAHTVIVRSDPPVPGLSFTLVERSYRPWQQATPAGLELVVRARGPLRVGVPADLAAPGSAPLHSVVDVVVALPAGVSVDRAALTSRVSGLPVSAWRAEDGAVYLDGVSVPSGTFTLDIPVVATLAGGLAPGASAVSLTTEPEAAFVRVPEVWGIGG